jgi:glycosyltransferase involved in cell wall biosynthesis
MGWFPDQLGGLNRYFTEFYRTLSTRVEGCRAVVTGPMATPSANVEVAGCANQPTLPRILRYSSVAIRRLPDAEVIDAHFALYALLPALASRLLRKPLVVHFHGPWAEETAAAGEERQAVITAKRMIERAVYRRADTVVVLSGAFKRILVERYGVAPWAVRVIPPGVDLERFVPDDRRQARGVLEIGDSQWVAVAARRLVPRMGLDLLLDAWAKAATTIPDGLLLVAGDGPDRVALETRAAALDLGDRVRFLGRVGDADLAVCYRAADVSVVPSTALEGFGLVVLEALACGTPVVATDVGGLPEALVGLDPSLIVPRGDPAALETRLEAAYEGRQPLPSCRACRAYAEGFSWDRTAAATLDLYRDATQPASRRRLRVVVLDHCARLSGAELALLRLLPAMRDVEFHVILGEDGPLASRLTALGISVEVLPMAERARGLQRAKVRPGRLPLGSALGAAAYTARLARHLRRVRPDLVHAYSLKAGLYGCAAARVTGIPVVWHMHDRIAEDYLPGPAVRLVRGLARRLPAAVITNSRATQATLPQVAGSVIPYPVLLRSDRPAMRARPGPLRLGMVGRLARWKGQHIFLEAFARAFPNGEERAVVVGSAMFGGDQEYASTLPPLAERLGVADRVTFTGFREDVAAELEQLDVLVHASIAPEPFGQVVTEGMAAGLVVVAAGEGGPAEIIHDGVDGLLTPPGDVEALARALRGLAAEPVVRRRLGEAAIRRVREFTPESVASNVLDVYQRVVGVGH